MTVLSWRVKEALHGVKEPCLLLMTYWNFRNYMQKTWSECRKSLRGIVHDNLNPFVWLYLLSKWNDLNDWDWPHDPKTSSHSQSFPFATFTEISYATIFFSLDEDDARKKESFAEDFVYSKISINKTFYLIEFFERHGWQRNNA